MSLTSMYPDSYVMTNGTLATMVPGSVPFGLIEDGAIAVQGERIAWVGKRSDVPADYADWPREDLYGDLLTPGLIDCHTHVIHAGDRSLEFERRLQGISYEEIARAGGGIMSTVHATRQASAEELFDSALNRMNHQHDEGGDDDRDQIGLRP